MAAPTTEVVVEELGRIGEYRLVIDKAGHQFVAVVVLLILGLPIAAYLSGILGVLFYVHFTLAAIWVGTDFFFRYSLAPAVGRSGPDTAMALIPTLTPRLMVVGESLTLGVIGSGIGLAHRFGYLAKPTIWVWGALVISIPIVFFAFVPLHTIKSRCSSNSIPPFPMENASGS